MSPTLHALIIGIDHYQGKVPQLDNAAQNAKDVHQFIKRRLRPQVNGKINLLTDRQAGRAQVIAALEGMARDAQPGDTCLFYFAGHGSEEATPEELYRVEKNEYLETIICADSRTGNVHDLADKELSCLIHQVSKGGKVHTAVIMDCCHAGDNTRKNKYGQKLRSAPQNETPRQLQQFYGVRQHPLPGYPPASEHIVLAACEAGQEAFDGYFTNELLKVLDIHATDSYQSIMSRASAMIRAETQCPGIFPPGSRLSSMSFLNGLLVGRS